MATGDQQDLAGRLQALLPRWFGDNPPLLTALLQGFAAAYCHIYSLVAYAKLQTRINTATGSWLDLIAADFFGSSVTRDPGQGDAALLGKIRVNLFRERATRSAVSRVLQDLTGRAPVIFEPMRAGDTGAYGERATAAVSNLAVYKTDWQGRQLLYATPRTNLVTSNLAWWGGTSVNAAGGQLAPDGSIDAVLVTSTINGFCNYDTAVVTTVKAADSLIEHVLVKAGTVSAFDFGIWDTTNGWGSGASTARIVSGPGALVQNASANSAFWHVSGLSATGWTLLELTRTGFASTTMQPGIYFYPRQAGASQIGDSFYLFCPDVKLGLTPSSLIKNSNPGMLTVTDYTPNANTLAFPAAIPASATIEVAGNFGALPFDYKFTGNGYDKSFTLTQGKSFACSYDVAGGYGADMPHQALVTVFRPRGTGIPNVAGYGYSAAAYGKPSVGGEYAAPSFMQSAIADSAIHAAIDVVRPAGTILWTQIVSDPLARQGVLDASFLLDRSALGGVSVDYLDTTFRLDQSILQDVPPAALDQNFTLGTSQLA
jgi:hypothetical protein